MRKRWKIFLIAICFIITGCTPENKKMVSKNTESVQLTVCTTEETTEKATEESTEETTENATTPMTEPTSAQEESSEATEPMLWYYMTTEEKWAYRFIRRYEDYGHKESLLYDIDYDGYTELILREAVGMCWGCYYISILDIFEDSLNLDKGFSAQLFDVPSDHEIMKDYFLPFSLYYDSDKKEYFYFGEGFVNDGKHPEEIRFFDRYNIGETVCVDRIASYIYYRRGEKSEGEKIYILEGESFGGQVIEEGFYSKSELYQILGIEDYLSIYELISDCVFEESDWKPLKDRQKDLAECAKNYPVTVD